MQTQALVDFLLALYCTTKRPRALCAPVACALQAIAEYTCYAICAPVMSCSHLLCNLCPEHSPNIVRSVLDASPARIVPVDRAALQRAAVCR